MEPEVQSAPLPVSMPLEGRVASHRLRTWLRLARNKPLGTFGLVIVVIMIVGGVFAPVLAPYGYNQSDIANRLQAPSFQHRFGTDGAGRDVLSRVIYGAQVSLYVGMGAAAIATVLATLLGVLSGYFGGKVDAIVQRFVDAAMSFPTLLLLMTIIAILGQGLWNVTVALGIAFAAGNSRVIRSAVLGVKVSPYIEASRCVGCTDRRIILRHVMPNVFAPIIVLATLAVGFAILAEASLSFLGLGVPPPQPSWGSMVSGVNRSYLMVAPWGVIFPGLALSLTMFGFNMLGDALRDILDPRLRGGGPAL